MIRSKKIVVLLCALYSSILLGTDSNQYDCNGMILESSNPIAETLRSGGGIYGGRYKYEYFDLSSKVAIDGLCVIASYNPTPYRIGIDYLLFDITLFYKYGATLPAVDVITNKISEIFADNPEWEINFTATNFYLDQNFGSSELNRRVKAKHVTNYGQWDKIAQLKSYNEEEVKALYKNYLLDPMVETCRSVGVRVTSYIE